MGTPLMLVNPGNSAISLLAEPSLPVMQKVGFSHAALQHQAGLAKNALDKKDYKDVIAAFWRSSLLRRKEKALLGGVTVGFGDGTPARLSVFEFDLNGSHTFVTELSGKVQSNKVEVEWEFEYLKDVGLLPDKFEDEEAVYSAPAYFFELVVGGKKATSALIEFVDSVEVELRDEEDEVIPHARFIAYFADGSRREGRLDAQGYYPLENVPPGNVHFQFSDIYMEKELVSALFSSEIALRDEVLKLELRTLGFIDGTPVTFNLFQVLDGSEELVETFNKEIKENRSVAEWKVGFKGDLKNLPCLPAKDQRYFTPEFYFEVEVEDQRLRSETIRFKDWLRLELRNEEDQLLPNTKVKILLADGSEQEKESNDDGIVELNKIPAGRVFVELIS
jgi:hypothetical protein